MKFGKRHLDASFVFDRLAEGKTQGELAKELGYSERSITTIIGRLRQHMGARTTAQAVAWHIGSRVQANLPIALQPVVDRVLKR